MENPEIQPALPEPAPLGPLAVGERIEGTLTEIGGKALLALSDGRSVSMDPTELTGDVAPELGLVLSAFVVRIDPNGEIWVSRARGSGALLLLLNARDHGEIVQGRVAAQGPGGLEIDLGGGIYATCPPAEVGEDVDNPGHLVGQTLNFKVLEASEGQIVLSRRTALQAGAPKGPDDQASVEEAADVRRRLRPGATVPGRISRVRDFGAFVDLGAGVEGLIHITELSHDRVSDPKQVVSAGQPVEVQVLKVDYDAHKGERISLSLKALSKSHWQQALDQLKVGERLKGKVARLEPFGAFVELPQGVTGLVHVSALGLKTPGKRVQHPGEVLKSGDEIEVEVLALDVEKRRVSLKRIPTEAEVVEKKAAQEAFREAKRTEARTKRQEAQKKPHERLSPGDVVDGVVDRIEPYGYFIQIKGGGRGMIHISEMGEPDPAAKPRGKPPKAASKSEAKAEAPAATPEATSPAPETVEPTAPPPEPTEAAAAPTAEAARAEPAAAAEPTALAAAPKAAHGKPTPADLFPKGTRIKAAVLEIDVEHRIRLSRVAIAELAKGTTVEAYVKRKAQHELEEKLLRSADRPPRPRGPKGQKGQRPERRGPDARGASGGPSPEQQRDPRERRDRPPRHRDGPPGRPTKSPSLGTLGDLLKAKLQQRKS